MKVKQIKPEPVTKTFQVTLTAEELTHIQWAGANGKNLSPHWQTVFKLCKELTSGEKN